MKRLKLFLLLVLMYMTTLGQQKSIIDQFSVSSCYVEMHHDNRYIGNATGFFMELNSKLFFITNNHVVSGEYARSEYYQIHKHQIPTDSIANNLKIRVYGDNVNAFKFITLPLLVGTDSTYIKMWEDEIAKKNLMDIVAIPVPTAIRNQMEKTLILTENNLNSTLRLAPSVELFIVGFPLNYASMSVYPLWKKGTIATEPLVQSVDNSSYFVDALTMGGMSGSPVYFRGSMGTNIDGGTDVYAGIATFLLGIYSAQNYQIGLGRVWRLDKVVTKLKAM